MPARPIRPIILLAVLYVLQPLGTLHPYCHHEGAFILSDKLYVRKKGIIRISFGRDRKWNVTYRPQNVHVRTGDH